MIHIRPARPHDTSTLLSFIKQLAEYEQAADEVTATENHIAHSFFCEQPKVFAVIAEYQGEAVAFAVYFFNYSTWQGQAGLYLEDLFVLPEYRGNGIGRALFTYLAKQAAAHHCGRFEWSVLDWNQPAIDFYQSLGAKAKTEWLGYRLEGLSLQQLANED